MSDFMLHFKKGKGLITLVSKLANKFIELDSSYTYDRIVPT